MTRRQIGRLRTIIRNLETLKCELPDAIWQEVSGDKLKHASRDLCDVVFRAEIALNPEPAPEPETWITIAERQHRRVLAGERR